MLRNLLLFTISMLISSLAYSQADSTNIDQLRTESGVDPTRVISKAVYSVWYFDRGENRSQINNRFNFTVGINRWSFALKPEIVTINNGVPGEGFQTNNGDMRFSILNAFYIQGKHSLAGAAEFTLPMAKQGFGSQYFSVNPSLTYAYTINQSLFLALSPQYSFHLQKDPGNPDLGVFTLRTFLAKFFSSGWFFVFEPRITSDEVNDTFDFIISPIIGKSLGAGFNFTSVLELPTRRETRNNRGVLVQLGVTKNF